MAASGRKGMSAGRCNQFHAGIVGGGRDAMQGVGVAADAGPVDAAPVGEQPVEDDHRAGAHFERHERVAGRWRFRQRRRVELFEQGPVVRGVALEDLAQRPAVPTRLGPQAAVVERGVLDGEPEAGDGDGIGVQERGVLVTADLAADARLLEDVHRLQGQRIDQTDVCGDLGDVRVVGEPLELVVEVVLRVADLVDAQLLRLRQLAIGAECLLLEEAPGARSAREELTVGDALLLVRGEDGSFLGWLPPVDDLERTPAQTPARVDRHEVGQDEEPVTLVRLDLLGTQHPAILRRRRNVTFDPAPWVAGGATASP